MRPCPLFPSDADPTRRERTVAGIATVGVHLLLMAWVLHTAGQGTDGVGGNVDGTAAGLAVTYITLSPNLTRAQPVPTATPQPAVVSPATGPAPKTSYAQSAPNDLLRVHSETGVQAATNPQPQQTAEASQAAAAAATSQKGGSLGDDLLTGYRAALRAAIQHKWAALTDRPFPTGCILQLNQKAGGAVTATSANGCAILQEDRLQLEAAALMAQPLPYAGYERVFSESIGLSL